MSNNPSFIRTDKAIMQAFIELLKEKAFEKITVQDILERTPVTRATFYAHYHDKYEIAERMLEQFLKSREFVRIELIDSAPSRMNTIVRKSFLSNHEIGKALLKIHTEKVDLRQTIVKEFEDFYMNTSNHRASLTEARIYAQARAEFELSYFYNSEAEISFEHSNELFINVALQLLRLGDDEEARDFLNKKIEQKFNLTKK